MVIAHQITMFVHVASYKVVNEDNESNLVAQNKDNVINAYNWKLLVLFTWPVVSYKEMQSK